MDEWHFTDLVTVRHIPSGFELTLIAGSWTKPLELHPHSPKQLPAYLVPSMIREGVEFAKAQKQPVKAKPEMRQSSSNTLSLSRKKKTRGDSTLPTPV